MRELIAASPAFQAWTGTADATAAAARVHLLVAPPDSPRPLTLIDFGDFARERVAVTNAAKWAQRSSSNLIVWFQADATAGEEPDPTIDFCNQVGAVWADMEKMAGVYEKAAFPANLIELASAPVRIEEEKRQTEGDYFECAISPSFTRQPV